MEKKRFRRLPFLRDWSVMRQAATFFSAFMFLACAVGIFVVYVSNMRALFAERTDATRRVADFVAQNMASSKNMPWLLSYWENNWDEIDFSYNDADALHEKFLALIETNPGIDFYALTPEQLEALSDDDRKSYAEGMYMLWTIYFARLADIYNFASLSCYTPKPQSNEIFYFLNARSIDEIGKGKTVAMLGSREESIAAKYPVRNLVWESGLMQKGYDNTGTGYYHVYAPLSASVIEPGVAPTFKPIAIVDAQLEVNSIRKELRGKVLKLEAISIVGLILSMLVLLVLVRVIISEPISTLQDAIQTYQISKKKDETIKIIKKYFGKNELGLLSYDFISLIIEVDDSLKKISTLTGENEKLSSQLSIAHTIQNAVLPNKFPPFPERTEFDIYASMKPASEIGGDFYDFFMLDNDHLVITIGDVSGKGIQAMLFMLYAKTILKNRLVSGEGPAEALAKLNSSIAKENAPDMFVSVWLAIYEVSSGKLTCANAGHEFPIFRRSAGKFAPIKDKHGLVLAGIDDVKYEEYTLRLGSGDTVFVHTDGVVEAVNSTSEQFGEARMLKSLNETQDTTPKGIVSKMNSDIAKFVGATEQGDDITMLVFKVV